MNVSESVKARLRECFLHAGRLVQCGRAPRLLIAVAGGARGWSVGLRGYEIAKSLRRRGWRVTVVPGWLTARQKRRIARWEKPDLVLLQSARPEENRPAFFRPAPCVLDLDDADFAEPRWRERTVEAARESIGAIAGSRYIANWLRQYTEEVRVVWTGSPLPRIRTNDNRERRQLVAWATSNPLRYYPREAELVQRVMLRVAKRQSCEFWLIGVGRDGQEEADRWLAPLRAKGLQCRVFPFMTNYEAFTQKLREVAIGLAPLQPEESAFSAGKSFGKVLAYLRSHVATVVSDCVDHSCFFKSGRNGYLVHGDDEWEEAVKTLLNAPQHRHDIARRAFDDYQRRLSTEAAVRLTDEFLKNRLVNMAKFRQGKFWSRPA